MKALGFGLAVMTYDGVEVIAAYARDEKLAYPALSDKGSAIIRSLGLFNHSYTPGSFAYGVAYPAILILDANGVVLHRFAEESYRDRPDVETVLRAAASAPPAQ